LVYSEMTRRIQPAKGQSPEDARKAFDGQLGVSGWGTPLYEVKDVERPDPGAPWWWQGEEEASSSFLASMGVAL
jgi:hypothetical protein